MGTVPIPVPPISAVLASEPERANYCVDVVSIEGSATGVGDASKVVASASRLSGSSDPAPDPSAAAS